MTQIPRSAFFTATVEDVEIVFNGVHSAVDKGPGAGQVSTRRQTDDDLDLCRWADDGGAEP